MTEGTSFKFLKTHCDLYHCDFKLSILLGATEISNLLWNLSEGISREDWIMQGF